MVILKRKSYKLFINSFKLSKFFAFVYSPPCHSELSTFNQKNHSLSSLYKFDFLTWNTFSHYFSSFLLCTFWSWNVSSWCHLGNLSSLLKESFPFPPTALCKQNSTSAHITLCFFVLTLELSQPVLPILETQWRGHCQASSVSEHPSVSSRGCNSAHTRILFSSFIVRFYWWWCCLLFLVGGGGGAQ